MVAIYREQESSFRKQRAGERRAPWLGAPASIAEDLALVLSSHMGQLTITCHSNSKDLIPSPGHPGYLHSHGVVHTDIHTYIKKIKSCKRAITKVNHHIEKNQLRRWEWHQGIVVWGQYTFSTRATDETVCLVGLKAYLICVPHWACSGCFITL